MKRSVLLILTIIMVAGASMAINKPELRANLRSQLKGAKTSADSLKILYDIYDLTPMLRRAGVAKEIYDLAERIDDQESQLEMLRDMAFVYAKNDTAIRQIVKVARRFPESDAQRETLTYVRVKGRTAMATRRPEDLDNMQVAKLLKQAGDSMPDNSQGINDRILDMFTLVAFLRQNTPGVLMDDILSVLGGTIEKLPLSLPDLRREFFSQSASAYTFIGLYDKGTYHSRQVVKDIMNQTEAMHRKGRKYYNDNYLLYLTYRRMLHNSVVLGSNDAQRIYNEIRALALEDPDVEADMKANHRAEINHYVSTSDWVNAIPLLRRQIHNPDNVDVKRRFVRYLYNGAKATHNIPLQLEVADLYVNICDSMLDNRYNERIREVQLMATMNVANERARQLEKEKIERSGQTRHMWILVSSIATPVLILMIVGLLLLYRRAVRLRHALEESYATLKTERDNVEKAKNEMMAARNRALVASRQKTDFINNMTHEVRTPLNAIADFSRLIADCVDEDHRPYLHHYVKLIELNNELVETIVNDVLDISEIDNNKMSVNVQPVNINPICELAIDNAKHYLRQGVTMHFEHPGIDDLTVKTDRRRMEQVLINLLSNAAKFTKEGSITLSYAIEGDNLVFSVTDTGSGIPEGKEELIFERFEKLDNSTQGAGLGLPIARLVAGLLKGAVTLDKSYRNGARFLFTLPLK